MGLEVEEGIGMGLLPENIEALKDGRPVANYVSLEVSEWLQTHRIELNSMTTPQFLDWLDKKIGYDKLIPPDEVLVEELRDKVRENLDQDIKDRILKEQNAEGQTKEAFEKVQPVIDEKIKELPQAVAEDLAENPAQSWREPVSKIAKTIKEAT